MKVKNKVKEKHNKKSLYILLICGIILLLGIILLFVILGDNEESVNLPEREDCGEGTTVYVNNDLCWQKSVKEGESINWNDANNYCQNLSLGEHEDWRLPNLGELSSIIEKDTDGLSINEKVFEDTAPKHFWTSEAYSSREGFHWFVHFEIGYTSFAPDFSEGYSVRCVRDN